MTTSEKKKKKRKWLSYSINALLIIVILILIIPSWRQTFQAWFTSNTLTEVEFEQSLTTPMPTGQRNWELINDHGELYNFADFKGKPVVIQFWATWCIYCKAAFPDLRELKENFNGEVVFLAVTTESLEVLQQSGYTDQYDFLYCTQMFPQFFEVTALPTLVIMDKSMNMVYKMEGAGDINNDNNVNFLKSLL